MGKAFVGAMSAREALGPSTWSPKAIGTVIPWLYFAAGFKTTVLRSSLAIIR